jgi:hypothetical protein
MHLMPGLLYVSRTLALLAALLVACATPQVKPPPPKPPESKHKMVNPLIDASDQGRGKISTWGVMGTIDRKVTEKGLSTQFPAVVGCFERQLRKEPYLGGTIKLTFRVDREGKVKQLYLAESDLGSLTVERCVLAELIQAAFPPPRGGESEFSFPLSFSGNVEPEWWSPSKVQRKLRRVKRARRGKQPPQLPPGLSLTFYVNRRGRVLSVGMSADGPIEEAVADELDKRVRRLRFKRHRMRYVKVSSPLS